MFVINRTHFINRWQMFFNDKLNFHTNNYIKIYLSKLGNPNNPLGEEQSIRLFKNNLFLTHHPLHIIPPRHRTCRDQS